MNDRTTGPTLTDRYVWAVTRHLDPDTGPDVARELRGSIMDTVEAKAEAGIDPERAEEEALTELGDPDVLAGQYGEKPRYLIGPDLYPGFLRLLKTLLGILVPVVLGLLLTERFVAGSNDVGDITLEVPAVLFGLTVHVCFWVTLAYAFVERVRPGSEQGGPATAWTTGQLPDETPWHRVGLPSTIFQALLMGLVIAIVTWQLIGVSDPTTQVQVLNPDLAPHWSVLLIGPLVAEVVVLFLVWKAGRWTPALVVGNVLASASWAMATVWLLLREQLITTDLPERLNAVFGIPADWSVATVPLALAVIAISVWEIGGCLRKTRQVALRT